MSTAIVSPTARPDAEQHRGEQAVLGGGQQHAVDHLPARRAEREAASR